MNGSQKIDHLKKKMKIHFLASVSPKFIKKYDEPVFLRHFSAKIQTHYTHFHHLTVHFYEKNHFKARRLKSVNFSVSRLRPHFPGKEWSFVYSNYVLYRFLAFWPFTNWICCSALKSHGRHSYSTLSLFSCD